MIPLKYISANVWHPVTSTNRRSLYPTPHSILRQASGTTEYKFVSESAGVEHILAAVVMPRGVPFKHLLAVPWAMTYTTPEWVMIIVSVEDQLSWIDMARASGAIGYMRSHAKCGVYKWFEPELDEHGLKIRAKSATSSTVNFRDESGSSPLKGTQRKNYDRAALVEDLRLGEYSHPELGARYGISRITVLKIAHQEGIRQVERAGVR